MSRSRTTALGSESAVSVEELRRPITTYFDQIWGPPENTGWVDESMSWKETCYIGDWSFVIDRRFTGPDVLRLFSDISVNTMAGFEVGQSKHVIHCSEEGKVVEQGVLSRFSDDVFVSMGTCAFWAAHIARRDGYDVAVEPADWFKFQVQGPSSLYLLEHLAGVRLRDVPYMRHRNIEIAGHDVVALRQGMSGEVGFELEGPREHGEEIWNAVFAAGQEFGIRRLGGRVAMINHLEACIPSATTDYLPAIYDAAHADYRRFLAEIDPVRYETSHAIAGSYHSDDVRDWYRSPVELGWTRQIKFDHEFIGRRALEEEMANPQRTMVTLVWNPDDLVDLYAALFRKDQPLPDFLEIPRDRRGYMYADTVLADGGLVGVSTSRGYSAYFREVISLCTIDVDQSHPGTEVMVLWGAPGTPQKEIRATVARAPYKDNRGRTDLTSLPATWREFRETVA
jgi:vanillate/3-O-methylgallate O-demethylase